MHVLETECLMHTLSMPTSHSFRIISLAINICSGNGS